MKKTKNSCKIFAILVLFIMIASILPIKSLATTKEKMIIKETDNLYYIYVAEVLGQNFEFAFSNSAEEENLNYIASEKDNTGNNIAYVNETLKNNFFNAENTYLWVKTTNETVISGEKITLENAKTIEELKNVENVTKTITITSTAKQEKIKINGNADETYTYQLFTLSSSEDYGKFLALVNEVNAFDENTNVVTKLKTYDELNELYNLLITNLEENNWVEAANQEIAKPYGAKEGTQYILWLKDSKGNVDVQFLTAYEEKVTVSEQVERNEEVNVGLPTTYDDTITLWIALAVVIVAIIAIVIFKAINKKSRGV